MMSQEKFNNLKIRLSTILKGIGSWLIEHKLLAAGILILLFLFLEYLSLPSNNEIAQLRKINPKITALMEQRVNQARRKGKQLRIQQRWISLGQVNDQMKHATIVAEDGTFYEHEGIDWYEMKESLKKDIEKGKFVRGASTITQQVAKNLFLSTSKDPIRKLKEIIIAKKMEDQLSKSRIFEIYLNIIEWGEGVFGVEAASMAYFNKHASELTREEAARLAAVIPNPLKHKPNVDNRYVNYRKNIILARMSARGW